MSEVHIIPERLAKLETATIKHGTGRSERALCIMQAVDYVTGSDAFTDHPPCASPRITQFLIGWNDRLPSDELRKEWLLPLIPLIVGTRTTAADEETRRAMLLDWDVRVAAPRWLRVAGLEEQAKALESLPPIRNMSDWETHRDQVAEIRNASWSRWRDARASLRSTVADAVRKRLGNKGAEAEAAAAAAEAAAAAAEAAAAAAAEAAAEAAAAAAAAEAEAAVGKIPTAVLRERTWTAVYNACRPIFREAIAKSDLTAKFRAAREAQRADMRDLVVALCNVGRTKPVEAA